MLFSPALWSFGFPDSRCHGKAGKDAQKPVISMAEIIQEMKYSPRDGANRTREASLGPVLELELGLWEASSFDKDDQKLAQKPESGARTLKT